MSFSGHVQNGQVVLDAPLPLADGVEVDVAVRSVTPSTTNGSHSLWDQMKTVVGKAEGLPADSSIKVDHYLNHGLTEK